MNDLLLFEKFDNLNIIKLPPRFQTAKQASRIISHKSDENPSHFSDLPADCQYFPRA